MGPLAGYSLCEPLSDLEGDSLGVLAVGDFFVPGPSAEEPWVRASSVFFPDGHAHFAPMVYQRMKVEPVCEEEHPAP